MRQAALGNQRKEPRRKTGLRIIRLVLPRKKMFTISKIAREVLPALKAGNARWSRLQFSPVELLVCPGLPNSDHARISQVLRLAGLGVLCGGAV
jgi:hypothetical protein